MERIKKIFSRPLTRILAILVVAGLLAAVGGGLYYTQQTPAQPIDFPHVLHVSLGVQCLYCHPSAVSGPVAGLPTTDKCWGCHQQIDRQSDELAKLAKYAQDRQSIPWVPVFIQPDFVHFNHQPHVARGLSCETCHGEIGSMKTASARPNQNMGWCLDCHNQQPQKVKLTDCSTCHY